MKKTFILAVVIAMATGFSYAAEEQQGFWFTLMKKLNTVSTRPVAGKTQTSVMGIRGAEDTTDTAGDGLYWKGESRPESTAGAVTEAEMADFKLAVDQASRGEKKRAMASFRTFKQTYPGSELTGDADSAIRQLEMELSSPAQ